MFRMTSAALTGAIATALIISPAHAQVSAELGIDDLVARLGATAPNGAGVVVGQVEALESTGNYGPNQANSEFVGKTFIAQSGPPGNSSHATLVGQNMYGSASGMAPGITTIYLYEAGSWLQSAFLRFNQGSGNPPLTPPGGLKIFNCSWVGSFGSTTFDNEALRRADFEINRDQTIVIVGVNNQPGAQQPLMCFGFNSISVGLTNGAHTAGLTPSGYDGPGRQKPEVVAPSQFTSFACPYVDAVAARLVQTARTAPLSSNANAQRADVLKAVLMAGCNHRAGWTNNPATSGANRGVTATPLDPLYGADVVNANNSHLILTGMEQDGTDSPPSTANVKRRGWDLASVGIGASKYYRFHLSAPASQVSILCAWNRIVTNDLTTWSVANFNLILQRVDSNGSLTTLVGNPGLPYFSDGNVVSQSTVDNVEHLLVRNLQPGDYTIQLQRVDSASGLRDVAIAWLLPKKAGDVNEDGSVNVSDLLAVINTWGACPAPCLPACPADVNGDCQVNVSDLLTLINNWG